MAGSYGRVVKDDGSLQPAKKICSMLECVSGDVAEAVEEMYGMIWYLADKAARGVEESWGDPEGTQNAADFVKDAQENYVEGLRLSPSTKGVLWRGE